MGINKWLEHVVISISLSVVRPLAESSSSWPTKLHEQVKTSVLYAQERKDMDVPDSIELSPTSCVKAVTSPTTTALEARASTATSSRTRTSSSSTPENTNSPWLTRDQTPMALSSSSLPQ